MKPSIQLGSQENATVQYTPLITYGEVLEVVLELHRAYYREKDDGAKHQLPNRPQLERGGTHLTTSENHRRLSTQSECSDSVICLQGETASSTRFSSNFSSPFNHTHSRFIFVQLIRQCTACQPHLLMTISLTPVLACSIHLTKSLPLTPHSSQRAS